MASFQEKEKREKNNPQSIIKARILSVIKKGVLDGLGEREFE